MGGGVGGRELNFLDLLHMINTHTNFQLPTSKTVILLIIVVKWGQFYPLGPSLGGRVGGGELNFLDPLHMRNTHSDFQLLTSKTDLTYYLSKKGAILPPMILPMGELGGG